MLAQARFATREGKYELAGEVGAEEGEAVEGAEDGDGDLAGLEMAVGDGLKVFGGDGFDGFEDFVEREKLTEVEFLTRQVHHARAGGFEREHEGTLEMIF